MPKQTRSDTFFSSAAPLLREGAPEVLHDAVRRLHYAVWISFRVDMTLRILGSAFRLAMPTEVDKAFHIMALELQDAAATKLDALYDTKPYRVCLPTIMPVLEANSSWIGQTQLTAHMLFQQARDRLASPEVAESKRRIGRWRNDEAGHIAWVSDEFRESIYEDLEILNDVTCDILRDLVQLVFRVNLRDSDSYRDVIATAMRDQLLAGRHPGLS